jgi:hypothetical protein
VKAEVVIVVVVVVVVIVVVVSVAAAVVVVLKRNVGICHPHSSRVTRYSKFMKLPKTFPFSPEELLLTFSKIQLLFPRTNFLLIKLTCF